jgi:hypothetical protein
LKESSVTDFFANARQFLLDLKDLILLATFVVALGISAYQFIKWKIHH